ncbi:hypothetical protein BKA93DRAFT_696523, partial [Sparassis latifolia]
ELDELEWGAIKLVCQWLLMFRQATEQMSSSKEVTLSSVHTIFHGLQEHLKNALRKLPPDSPPQLRDGLLRAYKKLSDYHSHFDESPYYI